MVEKKYIAPNAITAANMFLGYLSITASISGEIQKAIWFIVAAMFCDGLDGKAARKFDAFSEFGKEFDSFCDAISFGLAPSVLVYSILKNSKNMASFIIPISFIFALCAVMRLAKFNVITTASNEKDDFLGMPTPTAAAIVCSYILISEGINKHLGIDIFSNEVFVGLTLISAILMVSSILFSSPDKVLNFVPEKFKGTFIIFIIVTLRYSMFIMCCYYVLTALMKFLKTKSREESE